MNIFVAKLNYSTPSEKLRDTFEEFGEVTSAKVIMDRETGRSKGFGFVEMESEEAGNAAIANLNGAEVDGNRIVVKKAVPRDQYNSNGGGNRGGGGGGGGFRKDRY